MTTATATPTRRRKRSTAGKRKKSTSPPRTAAALTARKQKVFAHPLRVTIMQELAEATMSPTQLADKIGCPLPNLSYHVRMLVELGMIELVNTKPRRGAIEHYYKATGEFQKTVPMMPAVVDVELGTLRHVMRNVAKRYPADTRIHFIVDGAELCVAIGDKRWRVMPDGTTLREDAELANGGSDGR